MKVRRGSETEVGKRIAESSSAEATYKIRFREMNSAMAELHKALKDHAKRQEEDPENWGWAGDLGQVTRDMQEMIRFLTSGH